MGRRRCCCSDCTFAEDDFNRADENPVTGWTEVVGSGWHISTNRLIDPGSASGIAIHNTPHPAGTPNMVVDVDALGSDYGDKLRVYAAWEDSSHYIVAEVTLSETASDFKVFENTGGGESQVGSTVDAGEITLGVLSHLRICYCDDCNDEGGPRVIATVTTYDPVTQMYCVYRIEEDAAVQTGDQGGVGVESLTTRAEFDNFEINEMDLTNVRCPTCGAECEVCLIDGEIPTQVQVSLTWNRTPSSDCSPTITWDCGCFDTICGSLIGQGGLFNPSSYFLDLVELCDGRCIYYYCEHMGIDCADDEDSPGEDCVDPADPDRLYLIIVGEPDFDTVPGKMLFTWYYYALWSVFADDGHLCSADVDVVLAKLAIVGGNECGQGLIGFSHIFDIHSPGATCDTVGEYYGNQPWGTIVVDAEGFPVLITTEPGPSMCDIFRLATPLDPVAPASWGATFIA